MAYGGINKLMPPRKSGGTPRVSTRSSLNVETGQADAGRDGRTCLARPDSQAQTRTGKYLGLCIVTDIRRYIDRYDVIYLSAEGFADISIYIGCDIYDISKCLPTASDVASSSLRTPRRT